MPTPSQLAVALVLASPLASALGQQTLYYEPFEQGAPWTFSSALAGVSAALPPELTNDGHPSGTTALALQDSTWNGGGNRAYVRATSPVIDLSGTSDPQLTFWTAYQHEWGCEWDANVHSIIRVSDSMVVHSECLSVTAPETARRWAQVRRALDPAWGAIRIQFSYDPIDWWNFNDWGYVVDDVRILDASCGASTLCEPAPMANQSPGPRIAAAGSWTTTSSDMRIEGSGFVPHTFASGFIGPETAILPAGNGTRCIAGGGTSRRLDVAPTRQNGTPVWNLSPMSPAYGAMIQAGQPVFVQTYYRDGGSFNFSEALRVDICQ